MHTFRTGRTRTLVVITLALGVTIVAPAMPSYADAVTAPAKTPAPTISTLSPTSGVVTGGAVVTITGTGFTGVTAVSFGGVPAKRFGASSSTKLTATTPTLDAGRYAVTVTTAAGTVTAGAFTVRTVEAEVLRLVNAARATKRKCGGKTYRAVRPLHADTTLAKVAAAHSADMAAHDYFSHYSRGGASPFDRMKAAGYRYSSAGENIAAGFNTPASVVKAWLKSSGHCKNIMKKSYTELGVGFSAGGYYGTYWTQDFGHPR